MKVILNMTTWCRRLYTEKAIASVLRQTYKDWELWIVDNGSWDDTPKYLKTLKDPRIHITLWPENRGLSAATNFAWERNNSKYVGRVDNDTLVPSEWLQTMIEYHEAYPEFGFIGGMHFDKEHLKDKRPKITEYGGKEIWKKPYIGGCSFLIKRADYDRFGPIGSGTQFFSPLMGLTDYQCQFTDAGKVNGFPYPYVFVDHMEHPRSQNHIRNEEYSEYCFKARALGSLDYGQVFDRDSQFYLNENNE